MPRRCLPLRKDLWNFRPRAQYIRDREAPWRDDLSRPPGRFSMSENGLPSALLRKHQLQHGLEELLLGRLTEMGQKAPVFEAGDEWPSRLRREDPLPFPPSCARIDW